MRTTHTGSLPRPDDLLAALLDRERGGAGPSAAQTRAAVAECVARQAELGLDLVNDGELGKISYVTYASSRLSGFAGSRPSGERELDPDFPEFARQRHEAVSAAAADVRMPVCTGPIAYVGADAVQADIDALRAALAEHPGVEGFLTAASPGVIASFLPDEHHGDRSAYLNALGEAMKEEYDAIHAAGLLVQVDCPDLAASRANFPPDADGLRAFRAQAEENLAVLEHALRDVPADRIRIHTCWGNYEGPHHRDVELRDIVDVLLGARAAMWSFEGANPRHEHEWAVFADVRLPDDKVVMPGVIDSTTNYVEHPQLVAQRIERYAHLVGPEHVIASTDCGMATFAVGAGGVDPRIAWAKLGSLVEGAHLAEV
ncbi:cobalamin-independent methionine synthase II family protein [Pseudonocardia sp. CA-107938]|uniref:cobalamin-independent methionine synthase II family protein n=1 Tax=Pseudonocardia sp. CA-107938 TaxID=3240021 RepID=UPI003D9015E5